MVLGQKGVKRVMKETAEYKANKDNCPYSLSFDEKDLGMIYAILRDMDGKYKNGEYILKIKLPEDYPFSPPVISCLTPSGRFEKETNICLSITHFHSETWSPLINIEKLIYSVMSVFYDQSISGIGSISGTPVQTIRDLAKQSKEYNTTHHKNILDRTI
jgi:ubiquitin-conjugating enzyme E2 J1